MYNVFVAVVPMYIIMHCINSIRCVHGRSDITGEESLGSISSVLLLHVYIVDDIAAISGQKCFLLNE